MKKSLIILLVICLAIVLTFSLVACNKNKGGDEQAAPITLKSIEVTQMPTKLEYEQGENISLEGLKVKVTFSDDKTEEIAVDKLNITKPATTDLGEKEVKIAYTLGDVTKEVSFKINVKHTHVYDQQKVDAAYLKSEATCTAKAVYYKSCKCGEKGSETFENGDFKPHVYDQQKTDAKYLKTAATCTAKAVYYKSCSCGEKGTETFEYGNTLGHDIDKTGKCTREGCTVNAENAISIGQDGCQKSYNVFEGKIYINFTTECNGKLTIRDNQSHVQKIDTESIEIYKGNDFTTNLSSSLGTSTKVTGTTYDYATTGDLVATTKYYIILPLKEEYADATTLQLIVNYATYHSFNSCGLCDECGYDACIELDGEQSGEPIVVNTVYNNKDFSNHVYYKFDVPSNACPDKFLFRALTTTDDVQSIYLFYMDGELPNECTLDTYEYIEAQSRYECYSISDLELGKTYYLDVKFDGGYFEEDNEQIAIFFLTEHEFQSTGAGLGFEYCESCGKLFNGEYITFGNSLILPKDTEPGTYYAMFEGLKDNVHVDASVDNRYETYFYGFEFQPLDITAIHASTEKYGSDEDMLPIFVIIVLDEPLQDDYELSIYCENGEHDDLNGFCTNCGSFVIDQLLDRGDFDYYQMDTPYELERNGWVYFGLDYNQEDDGIQIDTVHYKIYGSCTVTQVILVGSDHMNDNMLDTTPVDVDTYKMKNNGVIKDTSGTKRFKYVVGLYIQSYTAGDEIDVLFCDHAYLEDL